MKVLHATKYTFLSSGCHLALGSLLFVSPLWAASRDLGADVSHYQGASGISQAAWAQMFAEGKRFAFIKASEGLTGADDAAMANNVARATAAGLLVGVYHFARPENRPTTNGAAPCPLSRALEPCFTCTRNVLNDRIESPCEKSLGAPRRDLDADVRASVCCARSRLTPCSPMTKRFFENLFRYCGR